MVNNLQTVADYVLQNKPELNEFMENIAVHARKVRASTFTGLTCSADQSSKVKKTYLHSNFRCEENENSLDLSDTQQQVILLVVFLQFHYNT